MVEEKIEDIWFLDSGCRNHMTGKISMFSMLDENVKSQVKLGRDSKVSSMGKWRVSVLTKKGEIKTISDVYYVPSILWGWCMYHHGHTIKQAKDFTSEDDKKQNVSSQDDSKFE